MGTCIHPAFKVKDPAQLWTVLRAIKKQGTANVSERYQRLYRHMMSQIDESSDAWKAHLAKSGGDSSIEVTRLHYVDRTAHELFKLQATSLRRDTFDLDVNVGVYELDGQYYLRPFYDRASFLGGSLDFVESMPELVDYHYQNKADPPEDVDPAEYEERGVVWDKIHSDAGCAECVLVLELSSWGLLWRLNPHLDIWKQLSGKWKEREKTDG